MKQTWGTKGIEENERQIIRKERKKEVMKVQRRNGTHTKKRRKNK